MTKAYPAESWAHTLDLIAAQGMRALHLNPASAALEPNGGPLSKRRARGVAEAAEKRGLAIAVVSGTYNMIHPDRGVRAAGFDRLTWLIRLAGMLGAPYVSLCTGTLDPLDMWRAHPGNDDPACFRLLESELEPALALCAETGVTLLVEPETSNVISTPQKALRLLTDMASPRLGVIMDAANLFRPGEAADMHETLLQAFGLLGPYIRVAHAKDIAPDGRGFTRPGLGLVDFPLYLSLLRQIDFCGALILHGFSASQTPDAANYLSSLWEG